MEYTRVEYFRLRFARILFFLLFLEILAVSSSSFCRPALKLKGKYVVNCVVPTACRIKYVVFFPDDDQIGSENEKNVDLIYAIFVVKRR